MDYRPLAEQLRPTKLSQVIGQPELTGQGKILAKMIKNRQSASLILWGPPGSGKTTLARIIASESAADFLELSAVQAGKAEINQAINHAQQNKRLGSQTILFIDEIHRFNKAQQDLLLPHVENGTLNLIGATTENPSFEVISPLLSRARVLILQPLSQESLVKIIKRAAKRLGLDSTHLPSDSVTLLAKLAGGDARRALNNLDLGLKLAGKKPLNKEIVLTAAQHKLPGYDKNGSQHYDLVSAFIKSMRGSDVVASTYYLARMVQAGEDPKFIARRMIIFASEDIGLAGNGALALANATFEAVAKVGLPEAEHNLYHCAIALARSPKSRQVTELMSSAKQLAKDYPDAAVPLNLRNPTTKLNTQLGYAKDYKWEADFKIANGFLPTEVASATAKPPK